MGIKFQSAQDGEITTRGTTSEKAIEVGKSKLMRGSFIGDASRLWNKAPIKIREEKSIWTVKKAIKEYCNSLPI